MLYQVNVCLGAWQEHGRAVECFNLQIGQAGTAESTTLANEVMLQAVALHAAPSYDLTIATSVNDSQAALV